MSVLPHIDGVIDRRLLINFRVDPEIARRVVPEPFRLNLSRGAAIGGICLIRLTELRPRGAPRGLGLTSESAAHRFAVEWDADDGGGHGVYIPRRDTNSRLSVLLGGRVFPGEHHRCSFRVNEENGRHDIALRSADGTTEVSVRAREDNRLPSGSVFRDIEDASEFFRHDSLGYSHTRQAGCYDGLELQAEQWKISPLAVEQLRSSFFDDQAIFPPGSVAFDCALWMHRTPAHWQSQPQLRVPTRVPLPG